MYDNDSRILSRMFPSLGFIGGTFADSLVLSIPWTFYGVRVTNLAENPDFVNFRAIIPMLNGKNTRPPADLSVEISSMRKNRAYHEHKLTISTQGVHSDKQLGAWWEATSKVPFEANGLRFMNRRDRWGSRSYKIRIDVLLEKGSWISVYDSNSSSYLTMVFSTLRRISQNTLPDWIPSTVEEGEEWNLQARHSVRKALDNSENILNINDWLVVSSILATAVDASGACLNDDSYRILAYGLCSQVWRDSAAKSGIASFGGVLKSREALERLRREVEMISSEKHNKLPLTVARHGIVPLGLLAVNEAAFASDMKQFISDIEGLGERSMLAYGTLLGSIRSGKFIEHDDDVDLFYTVTPARDEGMREANLRILGELSRLGWKVSDIPRYMNSHVTKTGSEFSVDIFPLYVGNDTFAVHMSRMEIEDIPVSWMAPGRTASIGSELFPVPLESEEFLRARYGSNWKVSDPYFDWGWRLEDF